MGEIAVAGGDLFRVAAALLGDPTRWSEIAQANALDDVLLDGLTILRVPDATARS